MNTSNPVALVTGSTRGIGFAVASLLGSRGYHVIALGRKKRSLEAVDDAIQAAGGPQPTLVPLKLQDVDAIQHLSAAIAQRWGRLDALVCNAATLGTLTPMVQIEQKQWDEVIAVNLSANWHLLRNFDPLLRNSDAGRVVALTSSVALEPKAYWAAYSVSKSGLENMILTYANETRITNVRANLFDPGAVATQLRAAAMPGEDQKLLPRPSDVAPAIADMCSAATLFTGQRVRYGSTGQK